MKVYIFHDSGTCGGGELLAFEAARKLCDIGIEVSIVTSSANLLRGCAEYLGFPIDFNIIEVRTLLDLLLPTTERFVRLRGKMSLLRRILQMRKVYSLL